MRLIDADKLISHLKDWLLQEAPYGVCEPESPQYETIRKCIKAVKEQPTAYNPNKVVEQMENVSVKEPLIENGIRVGTIKTIPLRFAIEIAKGGGVE